MKSITLTLVLFFCFISCLSQGQREKEQIRATVLRYWKAVRENNLSEYNNLIYNSDKYPGGISSELFFLNEYYDEINFNKDLLNNIKIKDTVDAFMPDIQMKYVQYIIEKENDSNNIRKPLVITLMFYKPVGYDKIYNPSILQNHIGWGK